MDFIVKVNDYRTLEHIGFRHFPSYEKLIKYYSKNSHKVIDKEYVKIDGEKAEWSRFPNL